MTNHDIDNLGGRELDAAVAELVMGWRWIDDDSRDCDGIFHGGKYLLPLGMSEDEARRQLPPKGTIRPFVFVRYYSADIASAWEVVRHLAQRGCLVRVQKLMGSDNTIRASAEFTWMRRNSPGDPRYAAGSWFTVAPTAPLAICRAALKAVHATAKAKA
jgi:hypothetical protein